MKIQYLLYPLLVLLASGCVSVPIQKANMLPGVDGQERYAINGLVRVPQMHEGVTKPYIENGMVSKCPNGLEYEELNELLNKETSFGTWVEWQAIVRCKPLT